MKAERQQSMTSSVDNSLAKAAALRSAGRHQEALEALRAIASQCHNNASYFFEVGIACYRLRRLEDAITAFLRNLELSPDGKSALINLGACYNEVGRNTEAIACYQRVIDLYPGNSGVWGNLAKALHDDGEHEASIFCYRKALEFGRNLQNLRGLALAWRKVGRFDRSRELLEEALRQDPGDARTHFGLAMNCLYQEQYEEGLKEFEWRLQLPKQLAFKAESPTLFEKPQYTGQDLRGKTLLVWTEQGFGDSLQFVRFLPLLREKADRLVMWCRPGLGRLFEANFPLDSVTENKNDLPEHDYQVSLMSLPYLLDPRLDILQDFKPYLAAVKGDKAIVERVPKIKNIGIVWGAEQLGYEYANKKVPLAELAPLFELPGIAWHSLQVGADAKDLNGFALAKRIIHHGDKLRDFADTARAIEDLDLVISVDTSVAHLAGAMGKPVWVMLPKYPDWRWQSDNKVSRWYPRSKLYFQTNVRKWNSVIDLVEKGVRSITHLNKQGIRRHCVITGTGRAGTTFLVKLLTHLGLDTGFRIDDLDKKTDPIANAGLEFSLRGQSCPYIVKSPAFCDYADEIFARVDIEIDHVFIPIRDLEAAAESRRRVTRDNIRMNRPDLRALKNTENPYPGGLWHTDSEAAGDQESILLRKVYSLLMECAGSTVPVTLLSYPKILKDPLNLFHKLKPILGTIEYPEFESCFNKVVDPKKIKPS